MTTNTIFDLASVSKPTGAGTAALLLVKEGRLSVDDLVCKYIPNYHSDVTVRHLMTHYSGLPAYLGAAGLEKRFLDIVSMWDMQISAAVISIRNF
jgi:CubicO group peptidase (beta-lactamase class C family)